MLTDYEPVHGGDTNETYSLHTNKQILFLKINDAALYPVMFEMEAAGLNALRHRSSLVLPAVIQQGILQGKQWMLLQWLEKGLPQKDTLANFGAALASLHLQPQAYFGWSTNNYVGSLQQINTRHTGWPTFYAACRVMPLVEMLFNSNAFSTHDVRHAEAFCAAIDHLLPHEPPALLHGDLWNGNYEVVAGGKVAVFDPAVYFGHREMDLGMTKLFGGFSQDFYRGYQEVYPLQPGWQQRLPFTQLYPLLVHAVLFGGHYVSRATEIMGRF